jgi:hypothetical protein
MKKTDHTKISIHMEKADRTAVLNMKYIGGRQRGVVSVLICREQFETVPYRHSIQVACTGWNLQPHIENCCG